MTLLFVQISKPLHLCACLLPGNGLWNRFHGLQIANVDDSDFEFPPYCTTYFTPMLTFARSAKFAVVSRSAGISVVYMQTVSLGEKVPLFPFNLRAGVRGSVGEKKTEK